MDRRTYKAARRMIIFQSISSLFEGLYGIQKTAQDEAWVDETFEEIVEGENVIEWNPEEEE